ncbi:hypothetical protein OESDEN_16232 [Oesophagostomum dentatum]|uniref:Uncharacterized protein n=1 Tax=Oesophagostomum dentatum TaxID=61180 RepID=A0A0B1SFG0_OESDE|nr:hypothetical protein OESDEN_16232 [Oesophagostomum dentatum]
MKCFCNCEEQLINASELEEAAQALTEEQQKQAEQIKTNPCVGMFAFCLSVDYFTLQRVLKLQNPDDF